DAQGRQRRDPPANRRRPRQPEADCPRQARGADQGHRRGGAQGAEGDARGEGTPLPARQGGRTLGREPRDLRRDRTRLGTLEGMEAALSHRALLRHDEVMKASMAARRRAISPTWLGLMLGTALFVAVWAGPLLAFWFVQQLPFELMFAIGPSLPTVITALLALIAVLIVGSVQNWAVRRAYLGNFVKLGIPTEIEALFEILP